MMNNKFLITRFLFLITLFTFIMMEEINAQIPTTSESNIPYQRSKKYVEKTILGKWQLDKKKLFNETLADYAKQGKLLTAKEKKELEDLIYSKNASMEFKEDGTLLQKLYDNPEEILQWTYKEEESKFLLTLPNGKKDSITITKLNSKFFIFNTSDGDVYFHKPKE
jgi:hypothetical protein